MTSYIERAARGVVQVIGFIIMWPIFMVALLIHWARSPKE